MSFELWIFYVLTVFVWLSTPGPSHLLMLSNGAAHGFHRALATAAGDLSANALQMLTASLGLVALISAFAGALTFIKWAGVLYLIYLGVRMIRKAELEYRDPETSLQKPTLSKLWWQGFVTSAANPKAVVFFVALFPQFIQPDLPFWQQFLVLFLTYIAIDGGFLLTYGYCADRIAVRLQKTSRVWVGRISGSLIIIAAFLLGLRSVK